MVEALAAVFIGFAGMAALIILRVRVLDRAERLRQEERNRKRAQILPPSHVRTYHHPPDLAPKENP